MQELLERTKERTWSWGLNTSNEGKLKDFRELLQQHGLLLSVYTSYDLDEIDADPLAVVVHKASQMTEEGVLVEDTSFEVEGADIGVNVRWRIRELAKYKGHKACLRTLIGFRVADKVFVFEGCVHGTIVEARGPLQKGFEINPYFLPAGESLTLAENSHDKINPRALAVAKIANRDYLAVRPLLMKWQGPWQSDVESKQRSNG